MTEQRIAAAIARLHWFNEVLKTLKPPPVLHDKLSKLIGGLEVDLAIAPSQNDIQTMLMASRLDLHQEIENMEVLTSEQKTFFGKLVNSVIDVMELGLDGDLFIDWTNLQGK